MFSTFRHAARHAVRLACLDYFVMIMRASLCSKSFMIKTEIIIRPTSSQSTRNVRVNYQFNLSLASFWFDLNWTVPHDQLAKKAVQMKLLNARKVVSAVGLTTIQFI